MLVALPLTVAWFAAAVLALLDGRRRWVGMVAVLLQALVLLALLVLGVEVLANGPLEIVTGAWPTNVGIRLRGDMLGLLFAGISAGILLVTLSYAVSQGIASRSFPALVLFLSTGLTGIFLTGDVFNFYVFFEVSMVAAFGLTGYGGDPKEIRAAMIFTIVNLLGSVFLLIAVAALYRVAGTLDMSGIAVANVEPRSLIVIATLLFVAFSLKLGLFPFHYWVPAVYRSARPVVTAILGGALANIGSYGLLRFGGNVLPAALDMLQPALIILGTASILYGGLLAVSCRLTNEVLAYSAIGQVGYILIALAVGGHIGYEAAVFYALANALNKVTLFLAIGLQGKFVGAAFAIGAFSVAGVPPSVGFLGKLELFRVGLAADSRVLMALIFAGGVLSFIYMFQTYQHNFWVSPRQQTPSPVTPRMLVLGLAALIVLIGCWPEPLLVLSRQAATIMGGPTL